MGNYCIDTCSLEQQQFILFFRNHSLKLCGLNNKPFSSHLVDIAAVAKPSKLWLYLICFKS